MTIFDSNIHAMTVTKKTGGTASTGQNRYAAMSVEPDATQPIQWGIDHIANPVFGTAFTLTAGMRFTAAGNVSIVLKSGTTFVLPVFAGEVLPIRATMVNSSGTTLTVAQIQLLY